LFKDYHIQLRLLFFKIIQFVKTFNLFESKSARSPAAPTLEHEKERKLKLELISTRVYILVLFLSTIPIIVYTSLRTTSETKTLDVSSYDNYQKLLNEYSSNALSCPCTTISNQYSNFLSIAPNSTHPVYHKPLFIENWIGMEFSFDGIPIEKNLPLIYLFYVRLTNIFCIFSQILVEREVKQFLATPYTTSFLIDKEQFKNYFNLQIDQFQKNLPSEYRRLIEMVRVTTSANSLMSATKTNYQWNFVTSTSKEIFLHLQQILPIVQYQTKPKYYQNHACSCQTQSKLCKEQLYWTNTKIPIPGMYLSCYFIDGLLKSTFECFYNVTCLKKLQVYMFPEYNPAQLVLEYPSNSSLYKMNSTVQQLLDVLFVEEWFRNITYELYYDKCKPRECHYTFIKRFELIYVITTTFSVLSGLVKVFHVLIPRIIEISHRLFQYFKRRRSIRLLANTNRINPIEPSSST